MLHWPKKSLVMPFYYINFDQNGPPYLLVYFFNTIFPFGLFFFTLTADPAGHALGSIYILSLTPEFYFGKGISKALDLHTGQAYDQIKTISCQDMSLL